VSAELTQARAAKTRYSNPHKHGCLWKQGVLSMVMPLEWMLLPDRDRVAGSPGGRWFMEVTMRERTLVAAVMLAVAGAASAQSGVPNPTPVQAPQGAQAIYKGVVGNLLEAVPLEAEDRVQLQRASVLISSPISARSLALALGVASGPLMVAGIVWGLWSATRIAPAQVAADRPRTPGAPPAGGAAAAGHQPVLWPGAVPARLVTSNDTIELNEGFSVAALDTMRDVAAPMVAAPGDGGFGYAPASALAGVVGSTAPAEQAVSCESCYLPLVASPPVSMRR
jgi:hypothetical protein